MVLDSIDTTDISDERNGIEEIDLFYKLPNSIDKDQEDDEIPNQ